LSDLAAEEALFEMSIYRAFVRLQTAKGLRFE
jgi:hypothetical protein